MDTAAAEAGYPSLIPPKRDATIGSTAVQQTPIHGDVITPESVPPIPSVPPLNAGAVPGLGPTYIGQSGPMVYPQAVSNPPHGMQAVAGNFNLQEEPPPSYDSLVPRVQPSQQPLPMQYPPYQQQQPLSTYPTSYHQPPVHFPPQPTGVVFVQMPYQGAVVQQPRPPPRIRTSFNFHLKEVHDNQLYLAVCLLVCVIMTINPLALTCVISGLYFAYKSARANQQNLYDEARKLHHTASRLNIGGVIVGVVHIPVFIAFIIFIAVISR